MKIAEVVNTFPPYHGGMGYICFHYAFELARREHDVTVFTLHYDRLRHENDPECFRIIRLNPLLRYGDGAAIPQLYAKLKDFDIIHLHYPFYGGAEYVYLASLLKGKKYFLTYHIDVYGNTLLKKLILGGYKSLFTRRIIRRAEGISSPGREYLEHSRIAPFVNWNNVVDMQYGGVDIQQFYPRPKNAKLVEHYRLEDKIVALFVGNLQPFKGLHILIDAISKIKDERIVLLIVGGGYGEERYKEQVKEKGLEHRVIFAGPKSPNKDLPDYYNLADFFVLPSTHSESFGLVVLEAMASGKPAIVSSLPGPSQLVEDGIDGMLVKVDDVEDLKNKIEYLAQRKELREIMGTAARKKVEEKYTWETIGEQLETIFRQILVR